MKYKNIREILMNLIPIAAFFLALLIGAIVIAILGVNPLIAYQALLKGAFGSMNAIADTIVKATPLLFVGLGICIAFRAGVLNIGGGGPACSRGSLCNHSLSCFSKFTGLDTNYNCFTCRAFKRSNMGRNCRVS